MLHYHSFSACSKILLRTEQWSLKCILTSKSSEVAVSSHLLISRSDIVKVEVMGIPWVHHEDPFLGDNANILPKIKTGALAEDWRQDIAIYYHGIKRDWIQQDWFRDDLVTLNLNILNHISEKVRKGSG